MKRILLLSIITMMACYSAAQKRDTVRLRVNYMAEFKRYVEDKKLRTDEMVLDIGHQQSRFYSRWHDFRWHITDSLIARELHSQRFRERFPTIREAECSTIFINTIRKKTG